MKFDWDHALSCKKGGFVSLQHNHIRNFTTTLLNEFCEDVQVEPQFQQLSDQTLQPSAGTKNEVLLHISAWGFW